MKNILTICLAAILMISADDAFAAKRAKVRRQNDPQKELKDKLNQYFISYRPSGQLVRSSAHLKSLIIDDSLKIIEVAADSHFGEQSFTPATTANIYNDILELLPDTCRQYKLKITTGGWEIGQLVANRLRQEPDASRSWGDVEYKGLPWVSNASLPYKITNGLQNRHLCLWASHGRYYNINKGEWCWQRPELFGTTEDLFTQTIVIPYLIPMLERAGAIVFTPRERDWQRHEVIVDNDTPRDRKSVV